MFNKKVKVNIVMKSGFVIEINCNEFSYEKTNGGNFTKISYEGFNGNIGIDLNDISAIYWEK